VCGCEGTVAGKGSHTLAFVGWVSFFFFVFMQQKFSYHSVVCLGLFTMNANVSALPFVGKSQYYQVCRIFLPMKGSACYGSFFIILINLFLLSKIILFLTPISLTSFLECAFV
jgi:hypothetical protein